MAEYDDVNTPMIAVVGVIATILVIAIVVLLVVVFYRVEADQRYAKDISRPEIEISELTAKQQGNLASYGWVKQERGIVSIPINRAMKLVVAEISRDRQAAHLGTEPSDTQEEDDVP